MPSTSELLLLADQRRPRTLQREIGPSDLGSCRRRVGYKLAGVDPVNMRGNVQAVMGSAVHDMVGDIMRELILESALDILGPDDLADHKVTFAGISGHLDRYEAPGTVVDTKTTSARWLEHVKLHGPEHSHLWQGHWYGAGLIEQGKPVTHIRIEYLARDTGEEWPVTVPFRMSVLREAVEWLKSVKETPVDMLPRDYAPDTAFCRSCPFGGLDGGICWENHVPGRGLRSALYVSDPDAQKWVEQLWESRQQANAYKGLGDEARDALKAVVDPNGTPTKVGDRWLRMDARGTMRFVSEPREHEMGDAG